MLVLLALCLKKDVKSEKNKIKAEQPPKWGFRVHKKLQGTY